LLLELSVSNFGIIEGIQWRLKPGLNVVTGETGAGKSLVVDAVESLLVGKIDADQVRHGAGSSRIEGVFQLPPDENLKELLSDNGLLDEDNLVISCEVGQPGRTQARVNGSAVTRGLLREIGEHLIDVHGQSQHLSLLNKNYHLDFLDAYGHTAALRQRFGGMASELAGAEQELKSLHQAEKDTSRREEFLRFQLEEIERAELEEGEEDELERERVLLSSCEKLKELSFAAYQALAGEDGGVSARDRLNEAVQLLGKLSELEPSREEQRRFLEDSLFGLEEAARELLVYHERLQYDPARLEVVESRLELLRNLKRKYGPTVGGVLEFLETARKELDTMSHSAERKTGLEGRCAQLKMEMGQLAGELSGARSRAAEQLAAQVKRELSDLNMGRVDFAVSICQLPDKDGIPFSGGESVAFTGDGADIVEFLVVTNPGEPYKPLARIASTGEISRFMLALKSALAGADNTPVLIFDEIDIGVGGRSGEIIGKKLWALARDRQVICVTHLPQIAAFADAHYTVHKEMAGERTRSILQVLEGDKRLEEMAVMLSGAQLTDTSRKNASEMLDKAEDWKKG